MRVLIDECAPKALKVFLAKHGHESRTVQEAGWAGKQNGELLKLAETHYDAFVTVNTNLRYQQNLQRPGIAIVILDYSSNRLDRLRQHFPACAAPSRKLSPVKSFNSPIPPNFGACIRRNV